MTLHITDSELFTYLGFTTSQQDLLRDFMKKKGFDTGKQLVAWCVRDTHVRYHPTPDNPIFKQLAGLPALD